MAIVYIGLGSNLDDPKAQVRLAIQELAIIPQCRVIAVSSLYQSPPLGPQDQPDYINAVVKLETLLPAQDLLEQMQQIELQHGRQHGRHWGPRTLDLDLLLYDLMTINTVQLTVPHPHIASRAFVLCPLLELAPDVEIPGRGLAQTLLEKLAVVDVLRL
jgi:2-amino-4-hydroxy-6-hydroxymethyldihydropteridine diphosphokinase